MLCFEPWAPGVKFADSDIKFDIRKNHLKHDSGIKPQGLAVLQGVLDGNVQVTANEKRYNNSTTGLTLVTTPYQNLSQFT